MQRKIVMVNPRARLGNPDVEISTQQGKTKVDAKPFGSHWATHNSFGKDGYTVSHLPSGTALEQGLAKRGAADAIAEFMADAFDFEDARVIVPAMMATGVLKMLQDTRRSKANGGRAYWEKQIASHVNSQRGIKRLKAKAKKAVGDQQPSAKATAKKRKAPKRRGKSEAELYAPYTSKIRKQMRGLKRGDVVTLEHVSISVADGLKRLGKKQRWAYAARHGGASAKGTEVELAKVPGESYRTERALLTLRPSGPLVLTYLRPDGGHGSGTYVLITSVKKASKKKTRKKPSKKKASKKTSKPATLPRLPSARDEAVKRTLLDRLLYLYPKGPQTFGAITGIASLKPFKKDSRRVLEELAGWGIVSKDGRRYRLTAHGKRHVEKHEATPKRTANIAPPESAAIDPTDTAYSEYAQLRDELEGAIAGGNDKSVVQLIGKARRELRNEPGWLSDVIQTAQDAGYLQEDALESNPSPFGVELAQVKRRLMR